ncbi:MAG: hypothetical protein QME57_04580, partial [Patescibacteria group bacterium]|nr:hypothetical protein [Patescibacteria group bacterium]
IASGDYSTAMGYKTIASGYYSTAMGSNTTASGQYSTAMGYYTTASGYSSTAMGFGTTASGHTSTAMGRGIEARGAYSVAIALDDQTGTVVSQSNTMSIMGGRVGIGTVSPTATLHVNGSVSKTSGSFDIPHPDPSKEKDGWHLRHSFVESPTRGDNLYRWTVEVKNGEAVIELPDYFRYLNENVQVWVSPKGHFGRGYGEVDIELTRITLKADSDGLYNVLALGTRKDKYAKEGFDELGVEYQAAKEEKK